MNVNKSRERNGAKMDVYDVIFTRRDIRKFEPDPVPDEVLWRILEAAHHAGSVGFMQPWNFILVRSLETRLKIQNLFHQENQKAAELYSGHQRELYDSLKLEGIVDAPLNIVVTCDRGRGGKHVLGRNTIPETDLFSTCCAVQNLWLAARAEGVGVGWVSIFDPAQVKQVFGIPEEVELVAYLCVGYPQEFPSEPTLERVGWRKRLPLEKVLMEEGWSQCSESLGE